MRGPAPARWRSGRRGARRGRVAALAVALGAGQAAEGVRVAHELEGRRRMHGPLARIGRVVVLHVSVSLVVGERLGFRPYSAADPR